MLKLLRTEADIGAARARLALDPVRNSGFLWRVFRSGSRFRVYVEERTGALMAREVSKDHLVFAGDWSATEIQRNLLPARGAFVSASPPEAIEQLKEHYGLKGEWPCWLFLAPEGFGPGPWDAIAPLTEEDVAFIAPFWELGGEGREEHIRESVKRFESACLRVGGKPVSWCGLHFEVQGIGNLGFAHTLEGHRRKGYARLVTKALVNKLHRKGSRATADVIKDNAASIATCKSMGFEAVGEQTWADFKRRE